MKCFHVLLLTVGLLGLACPTVAADTDRMPEWLRSVPRIPQQLDAMNMTMSATPLPSRSPSATPTASPPADYETSYISQYGSYNSYGQYDSYASMSPYAYTTGMYTPDMNSPGEVDDDGDGTAQFVYLVLSLVVVFGGMAIVVIVAYFYEKNEEESSFF